MQNAEKDEIRGILDENDVPLVTESLHGHVKKLLRTTGDEQAFGGVGRILAAIELPEVAGRQAAQICFTGRDAVLQGGLAEAGIPQEVGEQLMGEADGQAGVVGEAGGEGNQAGPGHGGGHQPRDGGRGGSAAKGGQRRN